MTPTRPSIEDARALLTDEVLAMIHNDAEVHASNVYCEDFDRSARDAARLCVWRERVCVTLAGLFSRLDAAERAQAWQPIETAPKDGTVILVHGGIAHWYVGDDCDGEWRTLTGFDHPGKTIHWPVTRWMPFPSPFRESPR
jgi:hypothetical protein